MIGVVAFFFVVLGIVVGQIIEIKKALKEIAATNQKSVELLQDLNDWLESVYRERR